MLIQEQFKTAKPNMEIAIIMTVFNRKDKTLKCLERFYGHPIPEDITYDVYLTDDGCTDGTAEAVKAAYPRVIIQKGNGNLFWAGGMNLSWVKAIAARKYDGYLWLNDDTFLDPSIFEEIIKADKYCKSTYSKGGIYVGSTTSVDGSKITYGGRKYINKVLDKTKIIKPNGQYQPCDFANGNIVYVSKDVVDSIGCFYPGYVHGADYDYTYCAHTKGYPILVMPNYMGKCDNDHKSVKESLISRDLKHRIKYLYANNGMQLKTALLFQKRFFPYRVPYVFLSYWLKALFPKIFCR